jgi:1-acyl-sn-glycerol-3-phosphate acyltransferase
MNTVRTVLLNTTFYAGFLVFSLVSIPSLTLFVALLRPFMTHRCAMRCFRRAISWYGVAVTRVLPFPFIRIDYRDCSESRSSGPFIFISNHRSLSDPFLMASLPYECVAIVNLWPFKIPVLGMFARLAGFMSINEMEVDDFYTKAGKYLDNGVSVISWPEGTRSGSRNMGQFHSSIFRLALLCRASIAPVCVSGNEMIPARGSLMLRPGVIRIRKLKEMTWEDYRDLSPFQLKARVRDAMAKKLSVLDGDALEPEKGE